MNDWLWRQAILFHGVILLCHCAQMPTYLTATDFANAAFVNTNQPMKVVLNDQRFHAKVRLVLGFV
jgi:hypothetical protein